MAGADASHTPEATFDAKLTMFSEQRILSEDHLLHATAKQHSMKMLT